jgi:acetylornithine deacetylase/succinyl-diaminopimelate desuccinylase-like protein
LVNEGYLPKVCILPDGGDNWQVQTGSKGMFLFEISVKGKTAHGSRPWLGDNALVKLIMVLDEIAALFPKYPHPDTNTISLTTINGGQSINQLPGRAKMTLDVRVLNSAEYARIHEAVLRICEHHQATCAIASDGVPTSYSLDNPYIAPYATIVTDVTGLPMRGFFAMGASDARYFVPFGTPCILTYPTGGSLHAEGEWIDAEAFLQFRVIISRYIEEMAKTSSPLVDPLNI